MVGSANLNIMIKAARKAGRALVKDFREVEQLQVSMKGAGDFVSRADINAEKIIKDELRAARPTYGWIDISTNWAPPSNTIASVCASSPLILRFSVVLRPSNPRDCTRTRSETRSPWKTASGAITSAIMASGGAGKPIGMV